MTLGHDIKSGIAAVTGARRTFRCTSTLPYLHEDSCPPGCAWRFYYEWEREHHDDVPDVLITSAELCLHDGTVLPVKVTTLCGRWLSSIETLISDELMSEGER